MVIYKKEFYPELTQSDFDKHISPLFYYIKSLELPSVKFNNMKYLDLEEKYPYYNSCRAIVEGIWANYWDFNLDVYIENPKNFKEAICESYSQIVFSYLIRSFAQHIKRFDKGDISPEKTYEIYNKRLRETDFEEFSSYYHVIWSRCINLLKNKLEAIIESIKLTQKHRKEIQNNFGVMETSKILFIDSGGDTHNHGKSVMVIEFAKKEKIIFKPRSVSGELNYNKLIAKLNTFVSPKFPILKVINFSDYGFTSFVNTSEKNKNMYEAGRLAALFYFLNATDMHYSNILWTDEGPIPIDLETLFHPRRILEGKSESLNSAYYYLEKSVYGTGVLPINLSKKSSDHTVDVGFTGIRDDQSVSPFKVFEVKNGFTSKISIVWKKNKVDNTLSNDPNLEKEIFKRTEEIIKGFTQFYKQILHNKKYFSEFVIELFSGAHFRYIHNMTYRYEQILRLLTDSESSSNSETAQFLLSRIGILSMTSNKNIILSECKQLWRGDVPYFSTNFESDKIYDDNEVVSYMNNSPKKEFEEKMKKISIFDMNNQINIIKLAFIAKLADPHFDEKLEVTSAVEKNKDKNLEKLINGIVYFADNLKQSVLDDRYSHLPKTWVGPVAQFGKGWTPGVLGYDLYSGRVGPALSLLIAGHILNKKEFKNIAIDIFEKSAYILENQEYELRNLLVSGFGAFSGVPGLLWALFTAGDILENKKWKEVSLKSWDLLDESLIEKDEKFFDMISGKSGAILMRYKMDGNYILDSEVLKEKIDLAYTILDNRNDKTTSGIAHGLGHLLYFFSIIHQRKADNKIEKLIKKISSIIDSEYTNSNGVKEIYIVDNGDNTSSSWCNGLIGLLLAFYEGYKANVLNKDSVSNIITQIKQVRLSQVPILCHGSLGIFEILQYINKDQEFEKETKDILEILRKNTCSPDFILDYYINGKGRYTLSPGLMAGKSGSLLHLCKMLEPDIHVSPLTFDI
ncbi:type 2 lanthipeptide synthetase LanM [Staphylococcus equorum]|uniref:Type 2 lanthipeptide synthetase LanM n=1 Tax=Staphylococcus equorum TaxID=246432 RepID=A0A9X4R0I0_9STAP|nr:type 2 lanthipeptide synthetase LanM [Staphylococcus equorum]MDG0819673.1 type 2 lanthipeptide synthetase LanM [Staphylococcus equorum]MDG0840314.1 type 2 lanthipeptide synthetase LanM [Staphylococcus equorum]MDG0845997.1 type 2 lanthipeptide synthetase LanM [Staphylococcus equorum]